MADSSLQIKDIPLKGKLVTAVNGVSVGENFTELKNMRYTDTNPEMIGGQTKINSTALSTYLKTRSGIHYKKNDESHILIQAQNAGGTASAVLENTTAVPGTGDYSATAVHTDSGTGLGRFSGAPTGEVAYCNGTESLLWAGDEQRCSGFINFDPDGDFSYDFTDEITNDLTTEEATVALSSGGIDSNAMLLLHLDNNVTDDSPTTAHTVTNNNVTFSSSDVVFGTHSAVFNGTNASLTVPNDTDFDFSGGTWTIDARIKVDDLAADYPIYHHEHPMLSLAFTSGGTYEILAGDTVEGHISGATAVVEYIDLTSGSWAGGDAAGTLYWRTTDQTGTFQAENLDVGANPNVATVGSDSSSAGSDVFTISVQTDGSIQFLMENVYATILNLSTPTGLISAATWYHVEVVENSDDYYVFVNGSLKAYASSTARPEVNTTVVYFGYDTSTYFKGKFDELRVSDIARHTADFSIPAAAYTDNDTWGFFYVGSIRPLRGMKFYIGTANTTSGTMVAQYWDGSSWASASSLSDGTSSGGASLAQTGSVTFDDTESTAQLKYLNQSYIYWYRVYVTGLDTTTTIYRVTLDSSMQSVKDIWDGSARTCFSFQKFTTGYQDNTLNVKEEDYFSTTDETFADVSSLTTAQYLVAGFTEKQAALVFTMVAEGVNTTAGTIATVSYWNGSDWASISDIDDGTLDSGVSFAKSGVISWSPPASEFKTQISKEFKLYYYKIEFSQNLSASVKIDFVGGIPKQTTIRGYKFPVYAQDRLFLCSDQSGDKNSVIVSAYNTSSVFNGTDTERFYFGDDTEIVSGMSLYGQFGSSLYNIVVICKKNETWIISGAGPSDWKKYAASHKIGCAAPLTMTSAHLNTEVLPGFNRNVGVWQSIDGIYVFDGRTFLPIHYDIDNYFDKRNPNGINRSKIGDSIGFFDDQNQEYHWLFASGTSTTLDKELVYDFRRQKWFEIERPTALQFGMSVEDTDGNTYNYGMIDSGYTYRLENGNNFDSTAITGTLETGSIYLGGSPLIESTVRSVRLTTAAKTSTTNNVTLSHYGDTATTATGTITMDPTKSGYSIAAPAQTEGWGPYVTHGFKLEMTTDDETVGFEPIYLSIAYKLVRIERR